MLTLLVVGMIGIGLVFVLSASSVMSMAHSQNAWAVFVRQAQFAVLGCVAFYVGARVDYRVWNRWAPVLLGLTLVTLFVVLIPGIGRKVGPSYRWIGSSTFGFQPSEVAKLVLVFFAARLLARRLDSLDDWKQSLLPVMIVTATLCFLVILEPDLDTAIEIGLITFCVLLAAGIPWKHLWTLVGAGAAVVGLYVLLTPFRRGRLEVFLHPETASKDKAWQITQSLIALGNGGWTGVGLGNGHAKWLFLPAAHTDFIFAIIGEETGVLGSLFVLAMFGLFAVVGCKTALRAPDRFGMLVAAGITAWVCGQTLLNIAMVVGLVPVTGTPLPFISAGGSSLVVLMAATGVLANIARQCTLPTPTRSPAHPALRRAHGVRVTPSA
jgi:cell division protein FtsW